jgi:hypothetical protein
MQVLNFDEWAVPDGGTVIDGLRYPHFVPLSMGLSISSIGLEDICENNDASNLLSEEEPERAATPDLESESDDDAKSRSDSESDSEEERFKSESDDDESEFGSSRPTFAWQLGEPLPQLRQDSLLQTKTAPAAATSSETPIPPAEPLPRAKSRPFDKFAISSSATGSATKGPKDKSADSAKKNAAASAVASIKSKQPAAPGKGASVTGSTGRKPLAAFGAKKLAEKQAAAKSASGAAQQKKSGQSKTTAKDPAETSNSEAITRTTAVQLTTARNSTPDLKGSSEEESSEDEAGTGPSSKVPLDIEVRRCLEEVRPLEHFHRHM